MKRLPGVLQVAIVLLMIAIGRPVAAAPIEIGAFSFSDEAGGFDLVSVTGRGLLEDPFIIRERLHGHGPVTLVIRRIEPERILHPWARNSGWRAVHVRIEVENASGVAWAGFELELQEIAGQPSVYGDGLSFDQGQPIPTSMGSDRFEVMERQMEPADRVRFERGGVDPGDIVRFAAKITDPTPVDIFYLVQDPQVLFASLDHFETVAIDNMLQGGDECCHGG